MKLPLGLDELDALVARRLRASAHPGERARREEVERALAREHGFVSWRRLRAHVERLGLEQPFRTDLRYCEERAAGIATTSGRSLAEARAELAARHGFRSWAALRQHLAALRRGDEPESAFMLAYEALEANDRERLTELLDRHPELVRQRSTNGNDLLGMAGRLELVRLLLDRGADPNRGNDYGWTRLHQAGYANEPKLARLLLDAGARTDLSARGEGGTPLIVALFWGHREVAGLLGLEPRNLRVAAGLGRLDLIHELAGTPQGGAHRGFYRPHGGFPAWKPSDDPQEILDEALAWAARSDRVEAVELLVQLGARVEADVYRGSALHWAAACGRVATIEKLLELGTEPNRRGTFGAPDHGEGVAPLHLAAQSGQRAAVGALLAAGADPALRGSLHDGPAWGWAAFCGHHDLAELLRSHSGHGAEAA